MSATVVSLASLVLAAAFGWAACAKALYWASWRSALTSYALPQALLPAIAVIVPALELLLFSLLIGGAILAGAALTIFLLGAFSMSVLRATMLHRSKRLPCGCFGRMKARDYRFLLVRNGFLGLLAAIVLIGGRVVDPLVTFGATSQVPVPEVFAGAVVVATIVHLSRRLNLLVRKRAESPAS